MNANDRIRQRIQTFVDELNDLVRQAALEAVSSSLKGAASVAPVAAPAAAKKVAAPRAAAPAAPAAAKPRAAAAAVSHAPGAKRPPQELEQLVEELAEYIMLNPGEGIESIARGLKRPSKELNLPIRKLLAGNRIVKKGQKRSTKYYQR